MKIGFYGHSNCAYLSDDSFLNILAKSLDASIVNTGTRQGSEERILYELKKTKNLDLAIIFHSSPSYLFLPGCDRDFDLKSIEAHASHIWQTAEIQQMTTSWEWHAEQHAKFVAKFKDVTTFTHVITNYKEYLHDPDLNMNRFYGALAQIDQYVTYKKIKTIHIVKPGYLPVWFNFTSGIVDTNVTQIIHTHTLSKKDVWCANGISLAGNLLVAEHLKQLCGQ
jgi:hypothetical protein